MKDGVRAISKKAFLGALLLTASVSAHDSMADAYSDYNACVSNADTAYNECVASGLNSSFCDQKHQNDINACTPPDTYSFCKNYAKDNLDGIATVILWIGKLCYDYDNGGLIGVYKNNN